MLLAPWSACARDSWFWPSRWHHAISALWLSRRLGSWTSLFLAISLIPTWSGPVFEVFRCLECYQGQASFGSRVACRYALWFEGSNGASSMVGRFYLTFWLVVFLSSWMQWQWMLPEMGSVWASQKAHQSLQTQNCHRLISPGFACGLPWASVCFGAVRRLFGLCRFGSCSLRSST